MLTSYPAQDGPAAKKYYSVQVGKLCQALGTADGHVCGTEGQHADTQPGVSSHITGTTQGGGWVCDSLG